MTTKRKRRGPRKATPKHLENAALHYLGRFASSAANLKRVLMRKVQRSAHFHGTDVGEGRATVEQLVARFARAGLIDDETYAAARAASLHRRGAAPKLIAARLREKGVAPATIERALETLGESSGDVELAAAVNLARRRRLGPYRPVTLAKGRAKAARSNRKRAASEREKALAALARAGFSYDVARRVIDADGIDELEQAAGLSPMSRRVSS